MSRSKKYKNPVRKNILMESEDLEYIQDYALLWGGSDTDFINKAIKEKINKLEQEKHNG